MSRPDVPRYYRISTRFWDDERSAKWPDAMKLAAVYFMTCKHRQLEGIYVLPLKYAASDLGWTEKRIRKVITFLESEGFLRYDASSNLLLIRNSLKYQTPESDNVIKGAIRRINDLPQSPLLLEFQELVAKHCLRRGAPVFAAVFSEEVDQVMKRRFPRPLEQPKRQSGELFNLNLEPKPKTETKIINGSAQSHRNGERDENSFLPSSENEANEEDPEGSIEGNTRQAGMTHPSTVMHGIMEHMTKGTWDHD